MGRSYSLVKRASALTSTCSPRFGPALPREPIIARQPCSFRVPSSSLVDVPPNHLSRFNLSTDNKPPIVHDASQEERPRASAIRCGDYSSRYLDRWLCPSSSSEDCQNDHRFAHHWCELGQDRAQRIRSLQNQDAPAHQASGWFPWIPSCCRSTAVPVLCLGWKLRACCDLIAR